MTAKKNGLYHKVYTNGTTPRAKGRKSTKGIGNAFENILEIPAKRSGISVVKIPSGVKWVMRRAIPVKTPFDFMFCRDGVAVFLDAKSTSSSNFSKSMITDHQLSSLLELERQGFRAGYVVFFRGIDRVVFFSATQLNSLFPRESLKPGQGMDLGSALTLELLPLFF